MVDGVRLVMIGKQGAGKGTQAQSLANHFTIPRVSTGDIFRASVKSGSEAGRKAEHYLNSGELVPDEVVVEVARECLNQPDTKSGFVLDGFPRNVTQAKALDEMLEPEAVDLVIKLVVPTEVVLERLAGRRVCSECGTNYSVQRPPSVDWTCDACGGKVVERHDDTEAAIKRRLALFEEQTAPLVTWYLERDRLAAVDGTGDPEAVFRRLLRAVEGRLAAKP